MRRFPRARYVDIDDFSGMIVHREKPWAIVAIITLGLTAIVSGSTRSDKSSATRNKLLPHLTRSVINDGLFGNELAPHSATCNRVGDVHNSSVWVHWDNLEPNRSDSKYPKNYQRYMLWNSPRYKRHLEFSETRLPNVSGSSQNGTKDTLIRIPLHRLRGTSQTTRMTHQEDPASSTSQSNDRAREGRSPRRRARAALSDFPSSRTRRSSTASDDQTSLRNTSDYYAERRAVMARFYARQREIEARFGNRTKASPQPVNAATSNVTLFRLYPSRNSTDDRAIFRHPSITIDPMYNPSLKQAGQPVVQEVERRRFESSNNSDVRVALDYTTPASCPNASLSGTFALKKQSKAANNYTDSVNKERHIHTTVIGRTSSVS